MFASVRCGVRYLSVPKAACCSIKAALLESQGYGRITDGSMHEHSYWATVPDDFKPKVTFTFVRHPLSRLQSSYREKLRRGLAARLYGSCPLSIDASFSEWVKWVTSQDPASADGHWAPQSVVLDNQGVDEYHAFKLEEVGRCWGWLRKHYGLPELPHLNKAPRGEVDCKYDAETYQRAMDYYREDLSRFDYNPSPFRPRSYEDVDGYMSVEELEELRRICADKTVLELGTWKGRSAIAMAGVARRVVSVDHSCGDDYASRADTHAAAWKNVKEHGVRKTVVLVVGEAIDLMKTVLSMRAFDIVFWDADHSEAQTSEALRVILALSRPDATIVVHDYCPDNPNLAGAVRAVDGSLGPLTRIVGRLAVKERE